MTIFNKALLTVTFLIGTGLSYAADYSSMRKVVYPVLMSSTIDKAQNSNEIITSSGSAVLIQEGYVLTAAHIVPTMNRTQMYVRANGHLIKATPIKIDRVADLALLAVDIKCPCVPVVVVPEPEIDSQVYTIGFPLYLTYGIQFVGIGSVQGEFSNNTVTTASTAPGGSGGGLFAKYKDGYHLVGITVAIAGASIGPRVMDIQQEHNWLSFNVRLATIVKFLKGTFVKVESVKAP